MLGVIFCLQVIAPQAGKALVEEGAHLAAQFLNHFVAGVAGLAVDEADEDKALRDGQVLQFLGVLFGDLRLGLFHQAVAFRFAGDVGQEGVILLHLCPGQLDTMFEDAPLLVWAIGCIAA